ncbi:hypothetical protein [Chryseobacterium sp. MP_3.2]|uniref:hypothetical protein n=1 Tax=Chryseobacterium sp. MP_3.2 TaxID=3071712 RepID=UPI002DF8F96D|nr:hypothetical protein [Chryseobacterium sp. MP_3.2]
MKYIIVLFTLLGFQNLIFSQEKKILKILNGQLKKEVRNQFRSPNFNGDTISIVKPYTISTNKILSFEIKKASSSSNGVQLVKQEVPLKMIRKIGKDINVIFETEHDAVTTTYSNQANGGKVDKVLGYLFFLYLSSDRHNETVGIELQKAFKTAGYIVGKEYWYD